MKKIFSLLILVIIFSCRNNKLHNEAKITEINIVQEWFANANYAGEVVAQHKFDSINGIELKLIEGSYEIDPIKMVLSGEAQIGVAGADKILIANDKGADLVIFGVINPISPVCFISLKENDITDVSEFKDKKIGVLTGTATEYVYRSLLDKEGIKASDLNEIEISFDLNTFINKVYDVRPAFIFDEPVSLDFQDIKYNIIYPSNYNINYLGTVYFCKREFLEKNKDLIQRVTNSLIEGWNYAIEHNEASIKYLKKSYPSIDEKRELASLKKGIDFFKGDDSKQLFAHPDKWKVMAKSLEKLGVLERFNTNEIDNSFINHYYNVEGK